MSEQELRGVIRKFKPTTCLFDPIPTSPFHDCLDDLLLTLTKIVNDSLLSGSFLSVFKRAVVKPLLKKHTLDHNNLENYLHVTNLSFLSRVIDKIVLEHLCLLELPWSTYHPCHSTETALLNITNNILHALDDGDVAVLTFLDLSSAFDTMDHHILLHRLRSLYSISGTILSWFESYLTGRT